MHGWQERETESRKEIEVTAEKAAILDAAKQIGLPVIQKESTGMRSFDPIKFQPVRAHGLFDAEFANKDNDIIFHFWPYGFHESQAKGESTRPAFVADFEKHLKAALKKSFAENRLEVTHDKDMGAFFVKALDYASALSPFTLATDACRELYKILVPSDG